MTTFALRYLQFDDSYQDVKNKYDVKSTEFQILRVIAKASLRESLPIKVRNLLDMSSIASPATIHKAMKSLIAKGLLKVISDKFDARIKYLAPTPRAIRLFNELGELF